MKSRTQIVIFGAGHIGQALAYHLKPLGYSVTVMDKRHAMLDNIKNSEGKQIDDYKQALAPFRNSENTFFLIATHSHDEDYVVLKTLLTEEIKTPYIGVVASKRKAKEMMKQFESETGLKYEDNNLYTPVGLKTGGTLPHDIAISIIAEIQSVKYEKEGHLHMREN